jgi:hypothetical protein
MPPQFVDRLTAYRDAVGRENDKLIMAGEKPAEEAETLAKGPY